MSDFTKWPWTATYYWVDSADGTRVATLSDGLCYRADARLIAAAPEMFELLEQWVAPTFDHKTSGARHEATCLVCSARALHARIVQFGPHAHAGVWISKETSDKISRDGA